MLSVAVVGFGAFGRNHARVYGTLPDARLAAIVDPDRSARAEAERLHPEAAILESIDLLGPIDAASIAVPTERHAAIAEGLLSRGVACLVEKPIAPSIAEADLILEASRRHGRPVFVGQLERFNPALLAARREIHDPRFIEVHRLGSFSPRSLDIDVVLDLMVHDLDVILTLAGAFPERVEAIGVNVLTAKVDIANARLGFASGLVANVTASRVSKERIRKLRIFQPHCYLSLDFANRAFELFRVEPPRAAGERPTVAATEVRRDGEEPLRAELAAFLAAVRGEPSAPLATGLDGKEALRLALMVNDEMRAHGRG